MSDVILVDNNDNVLGETSREKAHQEGLLHRVAVTYVVNDKKEILVNERAKDGHLDHSSAGHVDVGESYLEAAKRELEEELGISGIELVDIGSTQAQDISETFNSRHMFRVYICKEAPIKINEDEVKSVFWATPRSIFEDMKVNPGKYTGGFKQTLQLFLFHIEK
jgi:isopentenyl-diphosphate delta-isomerase